ncbi:hypothetical protein KSP39_PZI019133 [Platanthera zijinensis]|uniref:Uncharacterized protein n=1 Tax=Platanthera zijinensis TaxID=2320716 RepID=A0AAP0B1B5_9ASPA
MWMRKKSIGGEHKAEMWFSTRLNRLIRRENHMNHKQLIVEQEVDRCGLERKQQKKLTTDRSEDVHETTIDRNTRTMLDQLMQGVARDQRRKQKDGIGRRNSTMEQFYTHSDIKYLEKQKLDESNIMLFNTENLHENPSNVNSIDMTESVQEALHRSSMEMSVLRDRDIIACKLFPVILSASSPYRQPRMSRPMPTEPHASKSAKGIIFVYFEPHTPRVPHTLIPCADV